MNNAQYTLSYVNGYYYAHWLDRRVGRYCTDWGNIKNIMITREIVVVVEQTIHQRPRRPVYYKITTNKEVFNIGRGCGQIIYSVNQRSWTVSDLWTTVMSLAFFANQRPRKIDNWGGTYSYIRVVHYWFPLKSIVFKVFEHEYMNMCPPIIDLSPRPLSPTNQVNAFSSVRGYVRQNSPSGKQA